MNPLELNQQALNARLASLRARLEGVDQAAEEMEGPPQLARLQSIFGLSNFERDLLLLCAAVELDSKIASLCAKAQGETSASCVTFALALSAVSEPHWSALSPSAPLRYWRLIEVVNQPGQPLTMSRLRADERILHFLTGIEYLDERLAGMVQPVVAAKEQIPSHGRLAAAVADVWMSLTQQPPLVQLCGRDEFSRRSVAAESCELAGLQLYSLAADRIPSAAAELSGAIRLWEREAALIPAALYIDADTIEKSDTRAISLVTQFVEQVNGKAVLSSRDRWRSLQKSVKTWDVPKPSAAEQGVLWKQLLGDASVEVNGHAAHLALQFDLTAPAIRISVQQALQSGSRGEALTAALWEASRTQARSRLDDLAQRIESSAHWDDLVLPVKEKSLLRAICSHVQHRVKVYEKWGFGGAGKRGLGISALFAGGSGTGKTMAAEVLASELRLDLCRIDLSGVVSKYIGETEKNLRRVFDAAEDGGAILFFDEADALFGKRSEVKDSHDRYANIEVNYLLQRMESYRGLAVLATNMRSALDTAFLRRIRFIVNFPFPEAEQRAEIWERVFPRSAPVSGLNIGRLARLPISGGNIRNIALNAAFMAAGDGNPIGMDHLARAARDEFVKMEKPVPESDLRSWQ